MGLKTGYKVVGLHAKNKKLYSFLSITWDGKFEQGSKSWVGMKRHYSKTKWTHRRKEYGALCVFDTIKNASDFYNRAGDQMADRFRLYECSYIPSTERKAYRPGSDPSYKIELGTANGIPNGTKFADSVILIKRVKPI